MMLFGADSFRPRKVQYEGDLEAKDGELSIELNKSASQSRLTWLRELILEDLSKGTSAGFIHIVRREKRLSPETVQHKLWLLGSPKVTFKEPFLDAAKSGTHRTGFVSKSWAR
jgi:hypothetical protein